MPDDSDKALLRKGLPRFLEIHGENIHREIDTIREWFYSGTKGYHVHKMLNSEHYALSNIIP